MVIEKRKGMKASVVLAAMVVVIATALVPIAAAATLYITADTYITGETAQYTMVADDLSGSGRLLIDGTIPAGYEVEQPDAGGKLVAKALFYNETGKKFATVFFNASSVSPQNEIDVYVIVDGASSSATIKNVNYTSGGSTTVDNITSASGNFKLSGGIKLPTGSGTGSMHAGVTLPDWVTVTKVVITTGKLVKNPEDAGPYSPTLSINGEDVPLDKPVPIRAPAALPALTPIGLIALVGLLSVVLVGATVRRRK